MNSQRLARKFIEILPAALLTQFHSLRRLASSDLDAGRPSLRTENQPEDF